jgi:transcriptional regulator GlxA family with amidase domain
MRPDTLAERRRLYLLANLLVKRRYREHLTLKIVAKTLASSPRQLQRAYEQFGRDTFREDLLARRMIAATELLSKHSIPVGDVARMVSYRQPPHFARSSGAATGFRRPSFAPNCTGQAPRAPEQHSRVTAVLRPASGGMAARVRS